MNKKLKQIMEDGWKEWHSDFLPDLVPSVVNPCFKFGFLAACDALIPLLRKAHIVVYAHAGALHMLDGFNAKKKDNEWDILSKEIESIIKSDT